MIWLRPDSGFNPEHQDREWDEVGYPKSEVAETALATLRATIGIIADLKSKWWFIENPYGPLRHFATMSGGTKLFHVSPEGRQGTPLS